METSFNFRRVDCLLSLFSKNCSLESLKPPLSSKNSTRYYFITFQSKQLSSLKKSRFIIKIDVLPENGIFFLLSPNKVLETVLETSFHFCIDDCLL